MPIYIARDKYNEKDFLEDYLREYQKKYEVNFPRAVIDDLLHSGRLTKLFKDKDIVISCVSKKNEFFCVVFDSAIFDSLMEKFKRSKEILSDYYGNACYIVPDYINLADEMVLHNSELLFGAEEIRNRVDKHEISWYEVLPDLSLEIVKDGMYNELSLVKGLECENIIGRKLSITPQDVFTLTRGELNYILPLNKSFVGEKNHFYVAKIEDKSFPLAADVEVKLRVEYSFASENSYRLFFEPVNPKDAPFSKIEAEWEEEVTSGEIIDLSIKDVVYSEEQVEFELNDKMPRGLSFFNNHVLDVQNGEVVKESRDGKKTEVMKDIMFDISKLINTEQRLSHYSDEVKKQVRNMFSEQNFLDKLIFLLEHTENELAANTCSDKRRNILQFRVVELEEAFTEISLNRKLFTENQLVYPEACFGRYFAEIQDDSEVIEIAYNKLIEISTKENYLEALSIRRYLQKLTGATAVNHLSIKHITEVNPSFGIYLLKVCVQILKEMSEYDWNQNSEGYINTPKENAYLIRSCVELIIALLFCRDSIAFCELCPGGQIAKKIIFYLKKINRNYYTAMKNWPDEKKQPKMDTKYHLKIERPHNLKNVWMEAYCLILCLSGDKRTNLIVAGD